MSAEKLAAQQTARLKQSLSRPDDLTCDHASDLLPALVEDELAGVDVDQQPKYEALLNHLDQCEACTTLYTQLAEELSVVAGIAGDLPPATPRPQSFFKPARESENVVLRILGGIARRFELVLRMPQFSSTVATLNGRSTLFTDALPEIEHAPVLSIVLHTSAPAPELVVAIRETTAGSRWQVQVNAGQTVRQAITDEHGIARFSDFVVTDVEQITLLCIELDSPS